MLVHGMREGDSRGGEILPGYDISKGGLIKMDKAELVKEVLMIKVT